jgi:lipopolysaccharide transport system permease protein
LEKGIKNSFYKKYSVIDEKKTIRQIFSEMLNDLRESKYLAWRLAKRDVSAQYRQSYLGYLWLIITPLFLTITWYFLNYTGVVQIQKTSIPYGAYIFIGTMMWQTFSEAVNGPLLAVNSGISLLSKLNFPREALILSSVYKLILSATIRLLLILPILWSFSIIPNWTILLSPILIFSLIITGTSIGLLLVPFGQIYSDIGRLIPMALQFFMYISPVIFTIPEKGIMKEVFKWNFITPILESIRDSFSAGNFEYLIPLIIVNILSLIILVFGWIIYRVTMPILIERMSN